MTNLENGGRMLCVAYFTGDLQCAASYAEGSSLWLLARCVENVLEDENGNGGITAHLWRELMSGDLAKLSSRRRVRAMGGGAQRSALDEERCLSVDGRGGCSDIEWALYTRVGMEFKKLVLCGSGGKY